jgi:hypothetical protein
MRRGQTLVASLAVIAIIAILAVVMMRGMGGAAPKPKADGRGVTVMGNAMATAKDSTCESNLSQMRQLLQVQKATDEEFKPMSPNDVPGASGVSKCPVGKETYLIDAQGQVTCPHLGHEKF